MGDNVSKSLQQDFSDNSNMGNVGRVHCTTRVVLVHTVRLRAIHLSRLMLINNTMFYMFLFNL